jgi:hypothetical protein
MSAKAIDSFKNNNVRTELKGHEEFVLRGLPTWSAAQQELDMKVHASMESF